VDLSSYGELGENHISDMVAKPTKSIVG